MLTPEKAIRYDSPFVLVIHLGIVACMKCDEWSFFLMNERWLHHLEEAVDRCEVQ